MLKIAHLSDIHLRCKYSGTYMDEIIRQRTMPTDYFITALKEISNADYDLIVLTGDLVHEGSAQDYAYLKELLDTYACGKPVLPVLGNHDFKKSFYEGFCQRTSDKPVYYVKYIHDYRFIVLDTSIEGEGDGYISDEQEKWLFRQLASPYKKGTVLLGHHPFKSEQSWFQTKLPENFIEKLQKTDVIAYLCGHAHFQESRKLGTFIQLTSEAFNYGVETRKQEVVYTETKGYCTCWLKEDGDIVSHMHVLTPYNPVFYTLSDEVRPPEGTVLRDTL